MGKVNSTKQYKARCIHGLCNGLELPTLQEQIYEVIRVFSTPQGAVVKREDIYDTVATRLCLPKDH